MADPRWWTLEVEDNPHDKIVQLVRELDDNLETKRERMMQCARLYDPNAEFMGADVEFRVGPYPLEEYRPPALNVVRSVIDTVSSMIAKNRPRAAFVTDNAEFSVAQRAKKLERFIEGEFQRTGIYDDAVKVFRDACVAGLGALKIFEDDGKVNIERVCWDELTVDDAECRAGPPRQLHQTRFVDREMLKVMYPDYVEEIDRACITDDKRNWTSYRYVEAQLVPVIESWHLPYGGKGGRHSIVIDGCTLLWEGWEFDHFPFVFYRWSEKVSGFWGTGLAEDLSGIQHRINCIADHIARCHAYANSFMLIHATDAGLGLKPIQGVPFQSMVYKGNNPPQFATPTLVQPELYDHLQYLIQVAYQIAGVSELSAHSSIPSGLDKASGIALQTFADIETQRFSIQSQRFEAMFLEAARQFVAIQKSMAGRDKKSSAAWNSRNLRETIEWSEVDLDEDLYTISIEAASLLSRTPAGRLQGAIELGNAALLERDEIRHLIGHPDLERTLSLKDAARDYANFVIEALNKGDYIPPEPLDNLNVTLPLVSNAFLIAKAGHADQDILDVYRLWLMAATDLMAPPQPITPEMGGGQPPMPGMAPGMPPGTLDLAPGLPPVPPQPVPGPVPTPPPMVMPPQGLA